MKQLRQEVVISIVGTQYYEDSQEDRIELVTQGNLDWTDDGYTLRYEESAVTGLEGTFTTFQKTGDSITLSREGNINTQIVFQKGRRHLALYNTEYGTMTVGVNTSHLASSLTQEGGKIEIEYAVEINRALTGNNIFDIKVKPSTSATLTQ